MREIQFRAWDVFKGRGMSKPFSLGCQHAEFTDGSEQPVDFVTQEHMQYTGLKDKNGVEIWEGDILQYEWDFDNTPPKEDARYKASHNRGMFGTEPVFPELVHSDDLGFKPFMGEGDWSDYNDGYEKAGSQNNMAVIGNIHENPELLTEKE